MESDIEDTGESYKVDYQPHIACHGGLTYKFVCTGSHNTAAVITWPNMYVKKMEIQRETDTFRVDSDL